MIPLEQAKAALEITGTEQDAAVQLMIDRATATLGRELLRYLGPPAEQVQVFDIPGANPYVTLAEEPAVSPALVMATRRDAFEGWETTDPALYRLDGLRVYHRTVWPFGLGTVQATYTAGFAVGAGPQELQDLILRALVERQSEAGIAATLGGGLKGETIGDYSYTNFTATELIGAAQAIGVSWQDIANRWRRRLL